MQIDSAHRHKRNSETPTSGRNSGRPSSEESVVAFASVSFSVDGAKSSSKEEVGGEGVGGEGVGETNVVAVVDVDVGDIVDVDDAAVDVDVDDAVAVAVVVVVVVVVDTTDVSSPTVVNTVVCPFDGDVGVGVGLGVGDGVGLGVGLGVGAAVGHTLPLGTITSNEAKHDC